MKPLRRSGKDIQFLQALGEQRRLAKINKIIRECSKIPMKKFTLTNRKIDDCLQGLKSIAKAHPQTTTDNKTVTRDFELPAKARILLLKATNLLQSKWEIRDKEQRELNLVLIPHGPNNSTSEQVGEFQIAFEELMNETHEIELPQVWLCCDKTDKPDAIDFTKAPIPFGYMVDLFGLVIIDADPDKTPLAEVRLTHRKIESVLTELKSLSKPHPHTLADGKTSTHDFDIPAKARRSLLLAMATLKEQFDARETRRMTSVMRYVPSGPENHSPEEVSAFAAAYEALMSEEVTVMLPRIPLFDQATERQDGIDFTKAPIPFDSVANLLGVVLFDPSETPAPLPPEGNSDSTPPPVM